MPGYVRTTIPESPKVSSLPPPDRFQAPEQVLSADRGAVAFMKHHIISSEVSKKRITEWFAQASPVVPGTTWTEKRRAVTIGEHTFLVEKEQIFQCLHCGTYDPQWSSVEVLTWLE